MTTSTPPVSITKEPDRLPPIPRQHRGRREALVGLFVALGVFAILASLFFFTDPAYFRGRYIIATAVDNAGGIRRGDPVQLKGVNIGRVKGFDIVEGRVLIRLEVEKKYRIPADSQVQIVSGGLIGGMTVEVLPGTSTQAVSTGATLPGKTGPSTLGQVENLTTKSQEVLGRVQELLSDRTLQGIESSSTELSDLLQQLSQLTREEHEHVAELTQSLAHSAGNVDQMTSSPELARSVHRLDTITNNLVGTTASLDHVSSSLETVLRRVELGKGTLGMLSSDNTLYVNVTEAAANMNRSASEIQRLIGDIRRDPRRFLHISIF